MKQVLRAAIAAVAAIALLWTAVAATAEQASPSLVHCAGKQTVPNVTVLGLGLGGSPLPAPRRSVVTGWSVRGGSAEGRFEQRLQVFRPVDGLVNTYYAVAATRPQMVPSDSRRPFEVRIRVARGDLFALRGTVETFVCRGVVGVTSAIHEGPTPTAARYEFKTEEGLGVPLSVTIEPDRDGDGYGDQTQDRCPRLPTTRNRCPAMKLRVEDTTVRMRSMLLLVSVATKAQAFVVGSVEYPLRPRAGRGIVTEPIESDHKTVRPGKATAFEIKLSKRLRRRLSERPPKRPLEAELDVRAINFFGDFEERRLTVRLPGRKSS